MLDGFVALHEGRPVIFHCRSGARTQSHAPRLAGKVGGACEAFIIDGGLEAWKKAGLPVVTDRRQPIEVQRQVQIGAGSLAFLGTMLGLFVSPWFFVVPAFVGAGWSWPADWVGWRASTGTRNRHVQRHRVRQGCLSNRTRR
jgi:hypothetical protein